MRKTSIVLLVLMFFFILCLRVSAGLKTKLMGDYYKFTKDEIEQMDNELRIVQPYGCGVFRYQSTPLLVMTDPSPCSFTAMKYVTVVGSDDTFALRTKWFSPSEDERTTGQSIAMLSYRRMYIADKENDCIQRIEYRPSTFSSLLMSPIGINAEVDGPCGVAVAKSDGSAKIYVADTKNHRIVRMDDVGMVEQYYGSYGNGVGEFNNPKSLAKYEDFLYVADTYNNRIVALLEDALE